MAAGEFLVGESWLCLRNINDNNNNKGAEPLKLMFFYGGERLNILKIPPKMLHRKHQISPFVYKIFWGRTPRPPFRGATTGGVGGAHPQYFWIIR